tara:strand:- start:247 stop:408 length:162 start_codon:yes stop_codon:yes gene_type:complete
MLGAFLSKSAAWPSWIEGQSFLFFHAIARQERPALCGIASYPSFPSLFCAFSQ